MYQSSMLVMKNGTKLGSTWACKKASGIVRVSLSMERNQLLMLNQSHWGAKLQASAFGLLRLK